jgi:hypothetical protein
MGSNGGNTGGSMAAPSFWDSGRAVLSGLGSGAVGVLVAAWFVVSGQVI